CDSVGFGVRGAGIGTFGRLARFGGGGGDGDNRVGGSGWLCPTPGWRACGGCDGLGSGVARPSPAGPGGGNGLGRGRDASSGANRCCPESPALAGRVNASSSVCSGALTTRGGGARLVFCSWSGGAGWVRASPSGGAGRMTASPIGLCSCRALGALLR